LESSNNFAKGTAGEILKKRLNFELSDTFHFNKVAHAFEKLITFIDWDNGGTLRHQKIPMPVIMELLVSLL
jgi:hypothetical protein